MSINDSIGEKLKRLRTEKRMTLKELSRLTDLSVGFLSQVENGKTSIAIDSLSKLATTLDVTLPYLFSEDGLDKDQLVMRSYDIVHKQKSPWRIEGSLTQNDHLSKIKPTILTLLPGTGTRPEPSAHSGEEFLFVLDGMVTLELNGIPEILYPYDSAHYKSTIPHIFWNNSKHTAHILSAHLSSENEPSSEVQDLSGKESL